MKVAVALSGGGSKGAFSAGVIKGILRKVDEFVCAFGSSTGSLVATCIAGGMYDFMTRVYTLVNTGNIVKPLIWEGIPFIGDNFDSPDIPLEALLGYSVLTKKLNIYSIAPLMELIDANVDFKELIKSKIDFGYLVSNWGKNTPRFYSNKQAATSPEALRKALEASVSIPIFMAPVKIPGSQGEFVDGGLTRHLPGQEILSSKRYKEADVVLFVSTIPIKPDTAKIPTNIISVLSHTLFGLSDSCDLNSLDYETLYVKTQAEKDGKKFIVVRPDADLGFSSSLDFNPGKMKIAFNVGIEKAKNEIIPYL